MATNLQTPILNSRMRSVNFFNGRLLTGDDLTAEQQANRAAHALLGQAVGSGVVYGLDVQDSAQLSSVQAPVLTVAKGLAVNRRGAALLLTDDANISLVRPPSATAAATMFQDCTPVQSGVYVAGAGVYLLTMSPATEPQGLAATTGISTSTASCNSNFNADGVQFRLVQLDLTPPELGDTNHLRNLVAFKFFAPADWASIVTNPFATPPASLGMLDQLRAAQAITDCEVPLSVLYWTATSGVVFVDMWSARRLLDPGAAAGTWAPFVAARRASESMAMFLQFQGQISDMIQFGIGGPLSSAVVTDFFRFLPPAGLVPIAGVGSPLGFNVGTFFGNFSSGQPTVVSQSELNRLLHDSWLYMPVDLNTPAMLQLYEVKLNVDAVSSGQTGQSYVLFLSREMLGFVEEDSVAGIFEQAWQVYRGLVTKRVFLPSDVTSDAIAARISILSAEQAVMAVANLKAAIASSRSMNYPDALSALSDLYSIQHELVLLFQSPIPGITDLQGRDTFTATLNTYLETAGPGGVPALNPSLGKGDLQSAVAAQAAINTFVGSWTGQGVATGFISVAYKNSPRGTQLVPGDPAAYPQVFTVTNNTDRTLTMVLSGTVSAPHGDWSKSLQFQSSGQAVGSITLVSTASQDVTVAITAPITATVGDAALLDFVVSAQPPNIQTGHGSLPMTIAAVAGPPIVHTVKFTGVSLPATDTTNATPGQIFSYGFTVRYAAVSPPNTELFTFSVTLTPSPTSVAASWFVDFSGAPVTQTAGAAGAAVYSTPVSLTSGAANDTSITVRVRAPLARTAADQSVSLAISIDSTDLPDHTSAQPSGQPFTVTLKHA